MDRERARELGLWDPDAPGADDRLAVLELLEAEGATLEEMVVADAKGRLVGLAGDRLVMPGRRVTLEEMAERSGVDLEMVLRVSRACGFPAPGPGDAVFPEAFASTIGVFPVAAQVFGEDVTLHLVRVISSSLQRIAEAAVSAVQVHVDAPLAGAGASELEIAQASLRNAQLLQGLWPIVELLLRAHIDRANDRRFELLVPAVGRETQHLAVGFVDVVGFTELSDELGVRELAAAVSELDAVASDVVTARSGRVVKLIGDEAMFVVPGAADACEIALELLDRIAAHPVLRGARAGLSAGDLVARDGDYFGTVVNLAARAAKAADPGVVLVSEELRAEAMDADGLRFEAAGETALKGFAKPVALWFVRRAD